MSKANPLGISNMFLWTDFARCLKRHEYRCLAGRGGCFSCSESVHMMIDCPKAKTNWSEGMLVNFSGLYG